MAQFRPGRERHADRAGQFAVDQRAGETMVLPRKGMLAATEDILTDNGIRQQGSADMLEVWNGKAAK